MATQLQTLTRRYDDPESVEWKKSVPTNENSKTPNDDDGNLIFQHLLAVCCTKNWANSQTTKRTLRIFQRPQSIDNLITNNLFSNSINKFWHFWTKKRSKMVWFGLIWPQKHFICQIRCSNLDVEFDQIQPISSIEFVIYNSKFEWIWMISYELTEHIPESRFFPEV